MFDLRMLSPEERQSYDEIVYDAIHDESGNVRPTAEFGSRFLAGLEDAEKFGHQWPRWLISDVAEAGLQRRAKEWLKQKDVISIADGESAFVTKAARMGVLRRNGEAVGYQQVFWSDMTVGDLLGVIGSATKRREADGINIITAQRLLDLCGAHGVSTVSEALDLEGASIDEFLGRSA